MLEGENMFKQTNFYVHNFGKFIVINRPKYGSRIFNLYWNAYLEKKLPNNLYLKRLSEVAFLNLYTINCSPKWECPHNVHLQTVSNNFDRLEVENPHLFLHTKTNLDTYKISDPDSLLKHPDYEYWKSEAVGFLKQVDYDNNVLLNKLWKGKRVDVPIYFVYRNPENHFKSGLLQDTGYHEFIDDKKKCFELFDFELGDSGYAGNHRGNYLSFLMPNLYHLPNIYFYNLDNETKLDFLNIFKTELDLNDARSLRVSILKTGMDEHEHRAQSSHKQAYSIVNEYFNKESVYNNFQNYYFSDIIWYNKLIKDKRNIIK